MFIIVNRGGIYFAETILKFTANSPQYTTVHTTNYTGFLLCWLLF